jgi:hypothetical protein
MDTAIAYAARGWAIFPCAWQGQRRKQPMTRHGLLDATLDLPTISDWWSRWPEALIATPTGLGFVVLDIDEQHGGFETMAAIGFTTAPLTPTVLTPSGGVHLYFAAPARPIRNTCGAAGRGIGDGVDWRGVGGYIVLPSPGSGYQWHLAFDSAPLAAVPAKLLPREPAYSAVSALSATTGLSRYAEAALDDACRKIMAAPDGEQEITLNTEVFSIGTLAGAGGIPADFALEVLIWAACQMADYDPRRPWRAEEIEAKVERAFTDGLNKPRKIATYG